jgi:hypothetical protein
MVCTVALAGLAVAGARAAEPQATFEEMEKCGRVQDPAQRLACYDALQPRIRAALAAGPEALSRDDQTSLFGLDFSGLFGSSEATTPENFGGDNLPRPEPAPGAARPIESITASVKEYAITPTGKFVVFLDNGQVWRQQQADTGTARFKSRDNKVVISRAMLGSYELQLNGGNKTFKVNRVK